MSKHLKLQCGNRPRGNLSSRQNNLSVQVFHNSDSRNGLDFGYGRRTRIWTCSMPNQEKTLMLSLNSEILGSNFGAAWRPQKRVRFSNQFFGMDVLYFGTNALFGRSVWFPIGLTRLATACPSENIAVSNAHWIRESQVSH